MSLDDLLAETFQAEQSAVHERRMTGVATPGVHPHDDVSVELRPRGWRGLPLARAALIALIAGFVGVATVALLQRSESTDVVVAAPDGATMAADTPQAAASAVDGAALCDLAASGSGELTYEAAATSAPAGPPPVIHRVTSTGSLERDGCLVVTVQVSNVYAASKDEPNASPQAIESFGSATLDHRDGDLELRLDSGLAKLEPWLEPSDDLHLDDGSIFEASNNRGQRVLRFALPAVAPALSVDGNTITIALAPDTAGDERLSAGPGDTVTVLGGRPLRNNQQTMILDGELASSDLIEPGAELRISGWAKGGIGLGEWHLYDVLNPTVEAASGVFGDPPDGAGWQPFDLAIDTGDLPAGDYNLELGSSDPTIPWSARCVAQWIRLGQATAPRIANPSLACIDDRGSLGGPTPTPPVDGPPALLPDDVRLCVTGIFSPDALNLREGPDTSFDVVAEMPQDSCVLFDTGVPAQRGWRRVRFESPQGTFHGWASGRYLSVAESVPAEAPVVAQVLVEKSITVKVLAAGQRSAFVDSPLLTSFDVFANAQRAGTLGADGTVVIMHRADADVTRIDLAAQQQDGCWWVGTGLLEKGASRVVITVERNCSCIADTGPPVCLALD